LQRTSETALLNDKFSRTVFCWSDPFSRHRTMGIRFPCGRSPPAIRGLSGALPPEQVKAASEADKQREQAKKGRKQSRRSLDRGV